MTARGVLFALSEKQVEELREAEDDESVIAVIAKIEERWDRRWLAELDKAWDAIHRSLTDGRLEYDNGEYPLKLAILGGLQLHEGDTYIVSVTTVEQVADVAKALARVDMAKLRAGYDGIDPADYDAELGDEDFAYAWSNFQELVKLYGRAADARRAVVFTVDL
jgi:Domain of unknown function (DUF1877)